MIKNNRLIIKFILILLVIASVLGIIGFTYSYFSLEVEGEPKDIVMNTGDLRLEYLDDTELKLEDAMPGDSITKKIIVKNIGTKEANYNMSWYNLVNTIDNFDLHLDMKCKSYKNYEEDNQEEYGECNSFYKAVPYTKTIINKIIKNGIDIDVGVTQEYEVTITFLDRPYPQNENKNKSFSGQIGLEECIDNTVYCTFDGELTAGVEYTNGQYIYKYKNRGYTNVNDSKLSWSLISNDGWGVQLADKDSTDEITSEICTYINDKPVISFASLYSHSQATSVDLSKVNTENVIYMNSMFQSSNFDSITGLENFNTSNTIRMDNMFWGVKAVLILVMLLI